MNQLPKSVTERLAKLGEHPLVHPDADLLTAFLEQKVTRTEREQVFAHLSQCFACREVVNLAAPEMKAGVAVSNVTGARFQWPLQWRWMRWIALATACLVVAAIGISLRPTLSERSASPQAASEVVREEESKAAVPRADKAVSAETLNVQRTVDSKRESASAATAKKPAVEDREKRDRSETATTHDLKSRDFAYSANATSEKDNREAALLADEKKQSAKLDQSLGVTAQNAPAPLAAPGKAGAAPGGVVAETIIRNDRNQVSQTRSQDLSGSPQQNKFLIQPQQAQTHALAKAPQPVDAFKDGVPPPAPPPPPASTSSAPSSSVTVANAEVAVDRDSRSKNEVGAITLERRRAAPKTKAILPNLGAVGFEGGTYNAASPTLKSSVGRALSWKISADGKLLRKTSGEDSWRKIELPSTVTLHSLASNNLDAWVGGAPLSGENSGALFHTTDGGEHWQRVGGPWTGDILALQASGAQHTSVLVRTAGGEWRTQDAGVNWIRTR